MFPQAFAACFCGADTVPTRKWRHDMAKLTKRTVDALKPQAKAYVAYDSELPGFGVRVMPSGHKGNAASTASDIVYNFLEINAMN